MTLYKIVVDPTGRKVRVNVSDSGSNRFRDIRLPHFVTNDDEQTTAAYVGHHVAANGVFVLQKNNEKINSNLAMTLGKPKLRNSFNGSGSTVSTANRVPSLGFLGVLN